MEKLPTDIIEYCIKSFLTKPECIVLDIELKPLFRKISEYEIRNSILDVEQDLTDYYYDDKWDKWDELQDDDIILLEESDTILYELE